MSDETDARKAQRSVGSLIVIMITGMIREYIAEVISKVPLILKVEETGPFARLKDGDYIIFEEYSLRLQGDDEATQNLLREASERGFPLASGLKRLGVTDGRLHYILPMPIE